MVKFLKNVILLPFLPIRLGWKWGREAKFVFGHGRKKEEVGGCAPRLFATIVSASLMYYGIYKAVLYFIGK